MTSSLEQVPEQIKCLHTLSRWCALQDSDLHSHRPTTPPTLNDILELLPVWLQWFDRGTNVDGDWNMMHIAGQGICCALFVNDLSTPDPLFDDMYVHHQQRIFISDEPISSYSIPQIQEIVCNIQAEFDSLFTLSDEGYSCGCDLTATILCVMKRLGYWMMNEFSTPNPEVLVSIATVDDSGWHTIRPDILRHILDGIHTILSTHDLLIAATLLVPDTSEQHRVELHPYHHEASMDYWWQMSSVADCPIGGIVQYKHKYQFLFHSVSQVVYYHFPAYNRRLQKKFEEIATKNWTTCPDNSGHESLHLLPLLLQTNPDIPVVYEHTGLGIVGESQPKNRFAWCVFGRFVLLVDHKQRPLQSFCAFDLRTLLLHTLPE